MASYAQQFGARPATRAEKVARGFKPGTRAYTLANGTVISHRALQTMGLRRQYNEIGKPSLETRAQYRREVMGVPSARHTFDRMVHHFATAPVSEGGLGAGYDSKTHRYILPNGERLGVQQVARLPEFRDKEIGTWEQWQRIRHIKGPYGQRVRFNFLDDLGYFEEFEPGKFRYIG